MQVYAAVISLLWYISALGVVNGSVRFPDTGLPERLADAETTFSFSVGQIAKLVCPFKKNPTILYNWQKIYPNEDQYVAAYDSRFEGRDSGRIMRIRSVTEKDAGTYRCTAVTGFGSEDADIHLYVTASTARSSKLKDGRSVQLQAEAPVISSTFPEIPENEKLIRLTGNVMMLDCQATGFPPPLIRWEKDGQPIKHDPGNAGDTKIVIEKARPEDGGNYTCIAVNQFGMKKHTFAVMVMERQPRKPKITEVLPNEREVREGEHVTLQCKIDSNDSTMQVNWFKVENPEGDTDFLRYQDKAYAKIEGGESSRLVDDHYLSKLPLGHVTLAHNGTYICLAISSIGYDSKEIDLIVRALHPKKSDMKLTAVLAFIGTCVTLMTIACLVRKFVGGKTRQRQAQLTQYDNAADGNRCCSDAEEGKENRSEDAAASRQRSCGAYTYIQPPPLETTAVKVSINPPSAPPPSVATSRSCLTSHSSLVQYDAQNYFEPPSGYRQPQNSCASSLPSSSNTFVSCGEEIEYETVYRNGRQAAQHVRRSRPFYV